MNIKDTPAGRVRDAVEIAANTNHTFLRGAPFESEHRLIGHERQRLERRFLFGEGLGDDALGRGVDAGIGYCVEPNPKLAVQVIEIAESSAEEKIFRTYRNGRSTFPFVLAR
jgi:hypothetical protein